MMSINLNSYLPRILFTGFTGFFLFLCCSSALAEDLTPADIVQRLQGEYEKTSSFGADFKQVTQMEMTRRTREANGSVKFKKPGMMRWEYHRPDIQVLASEGKTFVMYLEKEKQMIRTAAKDALESDVTYSFFAGTGNLTRDFIAMNPDMDFGLSESQYLVRLRPRESHPQVDYLYLWIRKKDFSLERVRIVDHFGSITDLFFSNIVQNLDYNNDLFIFRPPAGVEVIDR